MDKTRGFRKLKLENRGSINRNLDMLFYGIYKVNNTSCWFYFFSLSLYNGSKLKWNSLPNNIRIIPELSKSIYSIQPTLTQMSVYFTNRNFFSSNSIFIFPMAIKSRRTAHTDPPILFFDPWRPLTSPVELFCHKRTYASDSCEKNSLC